MSSLTTLALSLSLLAVVLSTGACLVALRGSGAHQSRLYAQLSERVSELTSQIETLVIAQRNLRSQVTMQAHRAKAKSEPEATAEPTSDEDKARVRRELSARLARGELSAIKPGG